jgi:hypothetical protein
MKINDNLGPEHAASVARDRAIVDRETARIRTTDTRLRTTDPASSQFAWKGRGRFRDTVLSAETTPRNPDMFGNAWQGDPKSEGSFAAGASPEDLNEANRKFWDDMAENNMPARPEGVAANDTQAKVQAMQRANDEFWKQQTSHQRTPARQWGKG